MMMTVTIVAYFRHNREGFMEVLVLYEPVSTGEKHKDTHESQRDSENEA